MPRSPFQFFPRALAAAVWVLVAAPVAVAAAAWTVAPPERQGMDAVALDRALDGLGEFGGVREALVARGGAIVAERRYAGTAGRPHDIKSASKSVIGALVGIAVREGLLRLDQPLAELLPGELVRGVAAAGRITVEHLLTMTSGLRSTSGEHYGAWVASSNYAAAALRRPLDAPPGSTFVYSTGNSHLLSAILAERSGSSTLDFARRHLLGPLDITVASWERAPEGYHFGGNSFAVTARDLARFGQLYLDGGRAGTRQLVPAQWVAASTRRHSEGWPQRYGAYGYLWWVRPGDPHPAAVAVGYGGQFLYVVPALDLLVVVFSTHEGKGADWDRRILRHLAHEIGGAARPLPARGAG